MRWDSALILFMLFPCFIHGNISDLENEHKERKRIEFLSDLIYLNQRPEGWSNIIFAGHLFPDYFYVKMKNLPLTFTLIPPNGTDVGINNVVPYYPTVVILNCPDFISFEKTLRKVMASPHWHPLSNTFLYYHAKEQEDIPKIFMIFWFYKISNGIVVQFDDNNNNLLISVYSPYVGENYKLSRHFGCWKKTKATKPVQNYRNDFVCVLGCQNVTLNSKLRRFFLGTCIGYETLRIGYGDVGSLKRTNLFEDRGKNLHGMVLMGSGAEVMPFLKVTINDNGTYTLGSRDGTVWKVAAERMNFTINLDAVKDVIKDRFDFNRNIQQISSFSKRQADVIIFPVYQFDLVIVEVDLSVAYKESGVCIISHRAGFDTVLFDEKILEANAELFINFVFCFLMIWFVFFIFNTVELGKFSLDQAGKDLVNTFRNVLSIGLYRPPKNNTFRIYLFVSIWGFFVINFVIQAVIVSFFTALKRGREVETFEDIIEKGYVIEGMASPDMLLPDDEERFRKFNSRFVSLPSIDGCVNNMLNDSRRFCPMDCSVARYLERNALNQKGEQYLHVVKDRIHSHYLNMILHKHSPLTNSFNRYLRKAFEGGLIKKWEQYRFSDMKDEVSIKALSLADLRAIFECFAVILGLSSSVFIVEVSAGIIKRINSYLKERITNKINTRVAKKRLKVERNQRKIKPVNAFTQTV